MLLRIPSVWRLHFLLLHNTWSFCINDYVHRSKRLIGTTSHFSIDSNQEISGSASSNRRVVNSVDRDLTGKMEMFCLARVYFPNSSKGSWLIVSIPNRTATWNHNSFLLKCYSTTFNFWVSAGIVNGAFYIDDISIESKVLVTFQINGCIPIILTASTALSMGCILDCRSS